VLNLLTIFGNGLRIAGMPFFLHIATFVHSLFKSHRRLALRQQLAMLKPSVKRPQVSPIDRLLIEKSASSSDKCSRQISVGVRLLPRASIHGELLKLGIDISQTTGSKYMVRQQKPPSQPWRTFLENHTDCIAGIDFFTLPTATFRILYVFIVLSHDRRYIVHFNVTAHPTAQWTAQQLVEAFPFDSAPRVCCVIGMPFIIILAERTVR
jgi:hypothetical protein